MKPPAVPWVVIAMLALVALLCLAIAHAAHAQVGAPTDCSGTVGTSSAPIKFPSSGGGPPRPQTYLSITNPAGVNKLAINPTGPAAIDSSGSLPMDITGAGWTWSGATGYPPPASVNIIASASSTPYTCKYQ